MKNTGEEGNNVQVSILLSTQESRSDGRIITVYSYSFLQTQKGNINTLSCASFIIMITKNQS